MCPSLTSRHTTLCHAMPPSATCASISRHITPCHVMSLPSQATSSYRVPHHTCHVTAHVECRVTHAAWTSLQPVCRPSRARCGRWRWGGRPFWGGGGGCRPPTGEPCSAAQRCGDSRGGVAELAPPRPRTRGLRLGEGPRLGGRPPAAVCGSLGKVPPLRRTPRCSCHARFHLPPTGGCAPHPHPRGLCWERGSGTRFETAEFLRFSFYSRAVFGIVQHGAVTPFRVTL